MLEVVLSIIGIIIGISIAFYLYWLEQERDKEREKVEENYNQWMRSQLERQGTLIRAIKESLPASRKEAFSAKVEVGNVRIGDVVIDKAYLDLAETFPGGETYVQASAHTERRESTSSRLVQSLETLEEGQTVVYVSPKGKSHDAKIKSIESIVSEEKRYYIFHIWLQIIR